MLRKIKGILVGVATVCAPAVVFADALTLPDLGVTAGDVIETGATEGGAVIGTGLAFAIGIAVVFFGFKMLKKVLKPA